MGVLVMASIAVRLWWGWVAHGRLEKQIQAIVSAGEPIDPSDFVSKPLPDDQNAAVPLRLAEDALIVTPLLSRSAGWLTIGIDVAEQERAATAALLRVPDPALDELVARNAEALALVREARAKRGTDWGDEFPETFWPARWPSRLKQHQLLAFACFRAVWSYHHTEHAELVESLRDALALAESVDSHPLLGHHLVSARYQRMICDIIDAVGPVCVNGFTALDTDGCGEEPKVNAGVRALIVQLLDEGHFRTRMVESRQVERMWMLGLGRMIIDTELSIRTIDTGRPGLPPSPTEKLLARIERPILELDLARLIGRWTSLVDAASAARWPAASARLPQDFFRDGGKHLIDLSPFTRRFGYATSYEIAMDFETMASRRLAAAALAVWLYRAEHENWPNDLSEVTPEYLPSVPQDPFAPDEREIRYVQVGELVKVYSVWVNGTDDGGHVESGENGLPDRGASDRVFVLGPSRQRSDGNGGPPEPNSP